jgi:Neocarzinostatin family/Carboxypeptidase regulatory-like domain
MNATVRTVLTTLFVGSLLFVAAPTAAQTTRTLTVTPDTGLVDGDVVQLAGSGYTPLGSVYFCQGVPDPMPGPEDCGGPISSVPADETGAFSATYTVQRFMAPSSVGATIDCAQPEATCAIGASDFFAPGAGTASAALTFTPQPPRTFAVTPDSGLVDGEVVTVEGTGFPPSSPVDFCQGIANGTVDVSDCGAPVEETIVDEAGEFSATYPVQRFIAFGPVMRDCAAPSAGCAMNFLLPNGSGLGQVTITFAPQTPVASLISGTVTDPEGAPVAGADVWAYTTSDTWVGSLQTVTAADGTYAFDGVVPGVSYRILFWRPPGSTLISEWFAGAQTRSVAFAITLAESEFVQADAELEEGSGIAGSVTDAAGNPIEGVAVSAYGFGDTWVGSYIVSTEADGSFLIENVRNDTFRIRFEPLTGSGLAFEWWQDAPNRRSADLVDVPPETTVTGIDAVLGPSP